MALNVIAPGAGQTSVLVGLAFVSFSAFEGWRAREQRQARAGRLLALSFFVFAIGVLFYPIPLAREIDGIVGVVDIAHLTSMVAITTTLILMYRLTTELTVEANVPLRAKLERLVWVLLGLYVADWTAAHLVTRLTEDLIYTGYYARPPLVGILNLLAGTIFIIAGSCASYGFFRMPRPTQAERIIVGAIRSSTIIAILYGAAICAQVAMDAVGGPQVIHRVMVPLGLTGVALALLGSGAFTDGLRLSSWMRRLAHPGPEPTVVNEPVNDLIRMTIFLDDHMLAARGAVKGLLNAVDDVCKGRGFSEEWTKLALQATRVGILDPDNGTAPFDRAIHQMCHYARRNDRFIGNVYRIVLATLGPDALPLNEDMPPIEPWHEELATAIRQAVYAYYGPERGRLVLANKGLVSLADEAMQTTR